MLFLRKGAEAPNWLEDNVLPSASSGSHKGQAGFSGCGTISKSAQWSRPSMESRTVLLSPRYFRKHLDTNLARSVHLKSSRRLCSSHPDFCAGDISQERLRLRTSPLLSGMGQPPQEGLLRMQFSVVCLLHYWTPRGTTAEITRETGDSR